MRLSVRGPENVDNNDCARMTSKNKNEKEKKNQRKNQKKTGGVKPKDCPTEYTPYLS